MKRILFSVLLLSATSSACSKECGSVGCPSGLHWQLDALFDDEQADGATVEVCRDDECLTGALPAPPSMSGTGNGISLKDGEAKVDLFLTAGKAGSLEIDLDWPLLADDEAQSHRYTIEVIAADGERLMQADSGVVNYERRYPNGRECGGDCLGAAVDQRGN